MAVSTHWFARFHEHAWNKEVDLDTDTLKVALFTSALSIDTDTNQHFDAAPFTSNELSGGGYARQTLASVTTGYDAADNRPYIDASDTTFANLTTATSGAPRYAVIYDDSPASNKPLVAYVDFGQDETRAAADLVLQWNAEGIVGVTVS